MATVSDADRVCISIRANYKKIFKLMRLSIPRTATFTEIFTKSLFTLWNRMGIMDVVEQGDVVKIDAGSKET